jgi:hypothetical protein
MTSRSKRKVTLQYFGHVEGGKLTLSRKALTADLRHISGPVLVTIETRASTRSHSLNAYYWAVPVAMLTEHFNTEMCFGRFVSEHYVHRLLEARFLPSEKIMLPDRSLIEFRLDGSKALTQEQFWNYIELIREWAQDMFNINIPEPTKSQTHEQTTSHH